MLNVILHGCNGRMGEVLSNLIKSDDGVTIVAGIDTKVSPKEYPVYDSFDKLKEKGDVIIDFSTAAAMDNLLAYCEKTHTPLVLCTTGLSEKQLKRIDDLSKVSAVLKSANMSLGINVLVKLLKNVASTLYDNGFDIEILEKHHNQKLDAPSGTALILADAVKEELGDVNYTFDRSKERKKRDKNEIGISSVRGGSVVGEHDVMFLGLDECIEIRHSAYSRTIFAKGALSAAKFLKDKKNGKYDMSDVIG